MYPTFQQPQRTQQFFSDVFDNYLGTPVCFLKRYPQIEDYQQVVNAIQLAQQLCDLCLAVNNQEIGNVLAKLDSDVAKRVKKVVKQKLASINKRLVLKILKETGNVLVGFNWNVNLVVSHSNSVSCHIPICALQLIIRQKNKPDETRVVLEMEKSQLNSFLEKLKGIQKQLK